MLLVCSPSRKVTLCESYCVIDGEQRRIPVIVAIYPKDGLVLLVICERCDNASDVVVEVNVTTSGNIPVVKGVDVRPTVPDNPDEHGRFIRCKEDTIPEIVCLIGRYPRFLDVELHLYEGSLGV